METRLQGLGVSPGIAIGPALVFQSGRPTASRHVISDVDAEIARLENAIAEVREELRALHQRAASEVGGAEAAILQAHLLLLDDEQLREGAIKTIREERRNAESVVDDVLQKHADLLEAQPERLLRERADDFRDIRDRLLQRLMGIHRPNLFELEQPAIIVSRSLSPTDAASLDVADTLALLTEAGSATSHTAILARAFGIPTVMGIHEASDRITDGAMLIVDGTSGTVLIEPDAATLEEYQQRKTAQALRAQAWRESAGGGQDCCTRDGSPIAIHANIALPQEVASAQGYGAQGIGLYRTEYLFLGHASSPTEEEQYQAYHSVAEAMYPKPVTLRTVDLGGDKLLPAAEAYPEPNPQLGWRAIRFCLDHEELFRTQLRALLRASLRGNLRIMFPMIADIAEFEAARRILEEAREELRAKGQEFAAEIPLGCMIEVPSAAIMADALAAKCAFFSLGTNDLIQYTLAVDRVNDQVAKYYQPGHPAVLWMIRRAALAAKAQGIPCAVCGEMAGDPSYTELLLGLGVTELSMSSVAIPAVCEKIRSTIMSEAEAFAARALLMESSEAVMNAIRERQATHD